MTLDDILDIITSAHRLHGGTTTRLSDGESLAGQDFYAVGVYPEAERILAPGCGLSMANVESFIRKNWTKLLGEHFALGTWQNPETDSCHLDVVLLVKSDYLESAKAIGRANKQISICYLKDSSIIYL